MNFLIEETEESTLKKLTRKEKQKKNWTFRKKNKKDMNHLGRREENWMKSKKN